MGAFSILDLVVLLTYLLGITIWGAWLGRHQRGGSDYFLGSRELPWGAVLLSVVATETSTLTFLSIPGVAYLGSLVFLQLTFGYLLGRIAISALFLPAYYRGEMKTAYALLEARFGTGTRRFASGIFMVMRLFADSGPSSGAHAAVLVWPDILSVRPAFRAMGKRLAESG
jgi:Na+/proline symporter